MKSEQIGDRKVILTKWMIIVFNAGTALFLGVLAFTGQAIPESVMTTFGLVNAAILGSFTGGNIVEHITGGKSGVVSSLMKKAQDKKPEQ